MKKKKKTSGFFKEGFVSNVEHFVRMDVSLPGKELPVCVKKKKKKVKPWKNFTPSPSRPHVAEVLSLR